MSLSFDVASLRRAYARRETSPVEIAREVLSRIAAAGDDGVWISRVPDDRLLADAAALERRGPEGLPLYGIPFAVKDNIDAAGLPTTAACPGFAYTPQASAPVVERLREAGALLVGKTNLDQFATGLVGVRSPYGVPRNPLNPAYIPGGSSSGSAVAVSAGLVSFALGTDTAGSGRMPAAFNNIVGLKPTHGLISAKGVVPACASLDCVSIFALTVADAAAVLDTVDYARVVPGFGAFAAKPPRFVFGVPRESQREFFGNTAAADLFEQAIIRCEAIGGTRVDIDYAPFLEVGALLYQGPWIAERHAAVADAIQGRWDLLHPVTRQIVEAGGSVTGPEVFRAQQQLAALAEQIAPMWRQIDLLLFPTTPTIYRVAEIEADPIGLNARLGYYTNATNLLDLSAIAVPNGFQPDGLPVGVTLIAPAFHDPLLAGIAAAFEEAAALPLGATGARLPGVSDAPKAVRFPYLPVAVVGAHLSGQPLNRELLALGARLRQETRTAPDYRLYALPDGKRPGLVRTPGDGAAIEVEVWDVPVGAIGAFLAGIAPPLGLGTVTLADGSEVTGFLCESRAIAAARDITPFGGWRAWLTSR